MKGGGKNTGGGRKTWGGARWGGGGISMSSTGGGDRGVGGQGR